MSKKLYSVKDRLMLHAHTQASVAKRGLELVNLKSLGFIPAPLAGGARGYHASGDVLTATADQVDLNKLWADYQAALEIFNEDRTTLVNFLTYNVAIASEQVYSSGDIAEFEEASEYGEPVGYRPSAVAQFMGYTFKWYDLAARFTWQFLADALAEQVTATANMAMEADNRLVFQLVMKTLFNNTRRTNKEGNIVFPFYSGVTTGPMPDDPPDYKTTTFANGHNHYVATDGALTPVDVQALQGLITEHGYDRNNGYALFLMVNEAEGNIIRGWRSEANGGPTGCLYDFIPAQGTSAFLLPENMRIDDNVSRPPATIDGLDVLGAFGQFLVIQENFIPAGYLVAFATGGEANIQNPIAIREHANSSLRGLRLVKGREPDYPLIDSFYQHGLGSGIRHRGAGAILQVTSIGDTTYEVPATYAW